MKYNWRDERRRTRNTIFTLLRDTPASNRWTRLFTRWEENLPLFLAVRAEETPTPRSDRTFSNFNYLKVNRVRRSLGSCVCGGGRQGGSKVCDCERERCLPFCTVLVCLWSGVSPTLEEATVIRATTTCTLIRRKKCSIAQMGPKRACSTFQRRRS